MGFPSTELTPSVVNGLHLLSLRRLWHSVLFSFCYSGHAVGNKPQISMAELHEHLFLVHIKSNAIWWGLYFIQLQKGPSFLPPMPLSVNIRLPRLSWQRERAGRQDILLLQNLLLEMTHVTLAYGPLARISNMVLSWYMGHTIAQLYHINFKLFKIILFCHYNSNACKGA